MSTLISNWENSSKFFLLFWPLILFMHNTFVISRMQMSLGLLLLLPFLSLSHTHTRRRGLNLICLHLLSHVLLPLSAPPSCLAARACWSSPSCPKTRTFSSW